MTRSPKNTQRDSRHRSFFFYATYETPRKAWTGNRNGFCGYVMMKMPAKTIIKILKLDTRQLQSLMQNEENERGMVLVAKRGILSSTCQQG